MRSGSRTRARPLFIVVRRTSSPEGVRTSILTCAARVSAGFQVAVRPSGEILAGSSLGMSATNGIDGKRYQERQFDPR